MSSFNSTAVAAGISPTMFMLSMVVQCLTQVLNPITFAMGVSLIILARISGFKCIEISSDDVNRYKKLAYMGTSYKNNKPSGVVFGKWFVCWMSREERGPRSATVFTQESFHQSVSKSQTEIVVKDKAPQTYHVYFQNGIFGESHISNISVDITKDGERSFQKKIIDVIVDLYEKKNNAVVFISGPAGCGKSVVVRQLIRRFAATEKYKCHFTSDFKCTTPGDKFSNWYTNISPEEDSPLIVLIDEVDGILKLLGGTGIPQHPKMQIQIRTKNDWNTFFDHIDNGYFKHTIFILTSNLSLKQIDEIDQSYTRDGRVDARFEIHDKAGESMTTHLAPPRQVITDGFSA